MNVIIYDITQSTAFQRLIKISMSSLSEPVTESRVDRKRRIARERIIAAAETLMRSRPIDEITISDITSAADVGHGTFYLHFKSKNDVLIPITRAMAERWDESIQAAHSAKDPAEVVAVSARLMGRAVTADPLWRWMLKHSGMPIDDIRHAIGRFAARDFGRGFQSGRFKVSHLATANSFMIGGFVTCLMGGFDSDDPGVIIDHMAELLLRTLGLDIAEAAKIAHQRLPPLLNE